MYLGFSSLVAKGSKLELTNERAGSDLTRMQAFRMGFLTNILNPKATLFFLSLFTLVISNSTPVYIVMIICVIIVGTALTWFITVSIFFTQQNVQQAFLKYEKGINRILGGFLIALGAKIAFSFII